MTFPMADEFMAHINQKINESQSMSRYCLKAVDYGFVYIDTEEIWGQIGKNKPKLNYLSLFFGHSQMMKDLNYRGQQFFFALSLLTNVIAKDYRNNDNLVSCLYNYTNTHEKGNFAGIGYRVAYGDMYSWFCIQLSPYINKDINESIKWLAYKCGESITSDSFERFRYYYVEADRFSILKNGLQNEFSFPLIDDIGKVVYDY